MKDKIDKSIAAKGKNYVIYIRESRMGFYVSGRVGKIKLAEFIPNKNSDNLMRSINNACRSFTLIKKMKIKNPKDYDNGKLKGYVGETEGFKIKIIK